MTPSRHPTSARLALAVGIALFAWGVYATAWLGDDGLICLRTAENTVAGHGMRWNVAERTQTFTAPGWQLALTAARAATGESYLTTLATGALFAAAALALLVHVRASVAAAALAVAALSSSRAFVEYSTSGLENPLGYATVALFVAAWFRSGDRDRRLARLSVAAGLVALTRYDLGLLVAPCLLAALPGVRAMRIVRHAAIGAIPLAAWMGFATFYYGSPWPVTAYAKAFCPDVPADELALRAVDYLWNLVAWDPVTAVTIAAGLSLAFTRLPRRGPSPAGSSVRPLMLGVLLHAAYLVRIGGDFMSGRFFAIPALLAAVVLARLPVGPRVAWTAVLAVPVFAWVAGRTPPWLAGPGYGAGLAPPAAVEISDERRYYYPRFGLRSPAREPLRGASMGAALDALPGVHRPVIQLMGTVGLPGYLAGPDVHIVDWWLCDPLLARLPMVRGLDWKVGHYTRRVPEGYLESLATGENRLRDQDLAALVDDLWLATRAPLWDAARFAAIGRLLGGHHAAGVARHVATEYHLPPRLEYPRVAPAAAGTPWWIEPMRVVYAGGHVWRTELLRTAQVEFALDGGDVYVLRWRRGGTEVATSQVETPGVGFVGAVRVTVPVPDAARDGFDAIQVDAGRSFDGVLAVGGFQALDDAAPGDGTSQGR